MTSSNSEPIRRVTGMRDVLPDEYERRRHTWETVCGAFELYGYRGIEVPTAEQMELHLRKSGEAIRQHMYTFQDLGQEYLCLRPELTASVARMYNENMTSWPLPQRLYYLGSAFRFDKPQRGRYREFTHAGVELIGGSTPEFDAEAIALACHAMDSLGIVDYEVVVGSIGIILALLSQKNLDERVKAYVVESLEQLSKAESLDAGLERLRGGLDGIGAALGGPDATETALLQSVAELPTEQTAAIVAWVIRTIYGTSDSGRDSNEIAHNLVRQLTRDQQIEDIRETVRFVSELIRIRGEPPGVLDQAERLIGEYGLDAEPIGELRSVAKYLDGYGVDWNKVRMDFGFGRGLQYYTGIIFEINVHHEALGPQQRQVCGGGRYDTLIGDLGGSRPVPALGFAFGLERLVLCRGDGDWPTRALDVFVAPIGGDAEYLHALGAARAFRMVGLRVTVGAVGLRPRDLTGAARRLGARFVVYVGEDEVTGGYLTLKDMEKATQLRCAIDDAIEAVGRR